MKKSGYIIFLLLISFGLSAQDIIKQEGEMIKITEDTVVTRVIDCNSLFTLNNRKKDRLKKRPFLYSEPYYLRIHNNEKDYAALQIAKRKGSKPILYVKMFTFNTCIKKDEVMEFILENGFRYRMKSIFDPNCDGFVVSDIRRKDIKKLTQSDVSSIKVMAFDRDYEFHLTEEEADRFQGELQCLRYNKFKYK